MHIYISHRTARGSLKYRIVIQRHPMRRFTKPTMHRTVIPLFDRAFLRPSMTLLAGHVKKKKRGGGGEKRTSGLHKPPGTNFSFRLDGKLIRPLRNSALMRATGKSIMQRRASSSARKTLSLHVNQQCEISSKQIIFRRTAEARRAAAIIRRAEALWSFRTGVRIEWRAISRTLHAISVIIV